MTSQAAVTGKTRLSRFQLKTLSPFFKFGPLAPTVFIFISGLVVISLFRAALTLNYFSRLSDTPDFLWLFAIGVRMDVLLLCYATIFPTLLMLLLPKSTVIKMRYFFATWYAGLMSLIAYMEIATFPFVDEYDARPDQKFLEYLEHVNEVGTMLVKAYLLELIVGVFAVAFFFRFFWISSLRLLENYSDWPLRTRPIILPIVMGIMFLGARSTLRHKPANLSTASFSTNHLANEFAANSLYSVLYSAYRMFRYEKNPSLDYGRLAKEEIFERVRKQADLPAETLLGEIPFLHTQKSPYKYDRPPNVVIFLQESIGASDVGCMGGPDIMPNLCALRKEGLWFSQLYATGTRTVRGIEATLSGFLPTSATGAVKLPHARRGFFTAAALFEEHGYDTSFLYGGMSNFDGMRAFCFGNGFDKIHDQPTFESPAFTGTWGVSDEDLVRKANEVFKGSGSKPFFSLILSTSNHSPFEFPDGRITLHEQPKQTHFNAVKYADYAIGLFFELAKKEEYYKNTIFVVVADHNWRVKGNDLVPMNQFHVPALMIGPNVPAKSFDLVSSQVDLVPTLLHFTGLETKHPMIGRNLMALSPEAKGRAFLQYGSNNAYWLDKDVVIFQPFQKPLQFKLENNVLVPAPLNEEMMKDGLAHALLPWTLYSERLYRIKSQEF